MSLVRKTLQQIVSDLSSDLSKGQIEKKLNKYCREHYPMHTIKDSILMLLKLPKSNIPMNIDISALDPKLELSLSSDESFLLKIIQIDPYTFKIASSVLKKDKKFILRVLQTTQYPRFIYRKLNDELKEDQDILDFVYPKSNIIYKSTQNSHATPSFINRSIMQRARLQNPYSTNSLAPYAKSVEVEFGEKLSPQRSPEKSPQRSAKNLGGGIKKTKKNKRKTKKI